MIQRVQPSPQGGYYTADTAVAAALEGEHVLLWVESATLRDAMHNYIAKHLASIEAQLPDCKIWREGDVYNIQHKLSQGYVHLTGNPRSLSDCYSKVYFDELRQVTDGHLAALERLHGIRRESFRSSKELGKFARG